MFLFTCARAASVQRARFYWPWIQTSHYLLSASGLEAWKQFGEARAGRRASGQQENCGSLVWNQVLAKLFLACRLKGNVVFEQFHPPFTPEATLEKPGIARHLCPLKLN